MIEQPRLAALGIAIMIVGLLWMGAAYLWGGGGDFEENSTLDDATESDHSPEPTAEAPSETGDSGTDTEATASPTEAGTADDGRSVGADGPVNTESPAIADDRDPPNESVSASDTDS